MPSTGAYTRPDYRGRVRSVLRGAYQQLPQDRATLVVLVGSELTRVPFGIMHGDIFQSLFGQMQVRFTVLPVYDPASTRLEPSWRDMFVQQAKHRRLGAIAGLSVRGLEEPALTFYAIDNPWSHAEVRLPPESLTRCWRFVVDENGRGEELRGTPAQEAWRLMSVDAATEDNTQGEP